MYNFATDRRNLKESVLNVMYDLKHLSFHLFAFNLDEQKVNGRKYSFREADENHVGKKHKQITVNV